MLRIAAFFFFFRFSQCGHRRSSSWNILFSSAAQVEALPDWKKLKQVSVSVARTSIARPTYLKLYDTIALASGKIHSPRFLQNRDISIRMVLLKLETEPGQQLMANCWSEKEIPTWEVRTRKPQWITGGTECHQTATSASTAPLANWKSYPESCWHWATLVAFCLDLDNTHLYVMRFSQQGILYSGVLAPEEGPGTHC